MRAQHNPNNNLNILNPLQGLGQANPLYSTKNAINGQKHLRGASVDALTNSVDIRSKMQQIVGTKGVREQSVRVSRFNGSNDELAHNSVHDKGLSSDLEQLSVSGLPKHSQSNQEQQNSIRKSLHGVTIDAKSRPEDDDQ